MVSSAYTITGIIFNIHLNERGRSGGTRASARGKERIHSEEKDYV